MTNTKIRYILDHDSATGFNPREILESRKVACRKFSDFVSSLEQHGGWVSLKKMQLMPKEPSSKKQFLKRKQEDLPRRGSRPSQIKQRPERREPEHRPSLISSKKFDQSYNSSTFTVSTNQFKPNFQADKYKSQAMEQYNRRMTYSPGHKKVPVNMNISGISSIKGPNQSFRSDFLSPHREPPSRYLKPEKMRSSYEPIIEDDAPEPYEIEDILLMPQSPVKKPNLEQNRKCTVSTLLQNIQDAKVGL